MFEISKRLASLTGRPFTLDGHMVGSIGEVYAQQFYGVELYPPGHAHHDGKYGEREVQIKATQGKSVVLRGEYDLLLVLKIDPNGNFKEIYNGDGKLPWQTLIAADRKKSKAGEISIRFNQLVKLNQSISDKDRIPCLNDKMKK